MFTKSKSTERTVEVLLILIVATLTCLLYRTGGYKLVVLNLFYLPVVLTAFFLGRYRAGVLALLSVIAASAVCIADLANFANFTSPIIIGLTITVWGATLGLIALLVGTISDELSSKIGELREAYVGVTEVLARYLQSANPKLKDRSVRVSELSHSVAKELRLSEKEVDNIRIAALLQDIENIEVTSRVIRKAMDDLEDTESNEEQHTFHGTDLVQSLGSVLSGAFPLVVNRNISDLDPIDVTDESAAEVPLGGRVIETVREFDTLVHGMFSTSDQSQKEAIAELKRDIDHHPAVLHALEKVISQQDVLDPQPVNHVVATEMVDQIPVGV